MLNDGGKLYRERYLKNVEAKGSGWYSFNKNGVHFIGLVNVLNLQAGGLGQLGDEQLEWLEADVKGLGTQHADCSLRAHPSLGGLSTMGMGHKRQRTRPGLSETFRLSDGSKRSYSPGAPESGRQCDFP